MNQARIFKPARAATQSGTARTKQWMLVFETNEKRKIEPLMGWTSSGDTLQQVKLSFDTKEEAIVYAEKHGIAYQIDEPKPIQRRIMAYSDNFKFNRKDAWTH